MIRRSKKARQRARLVKELDATARRAVFERDGHECVRCHLPFTKVQWSHVFSRRHKNLRWELDNALSLCAGCHFWWHENPVMSGDWFKKNWPDRYEHILTLYNAENRKVTLASMKERLQ